MSFREFQNEARLYQLSQEREKKLSELEILLGQASRRNIQQLLRLPDKIRTRDIDENPNYREAIKQLLQKYLERPAEKGQDEEKIELMRQIITEIDEVKRIFDEMAALQDPSNSGGNNHHGPESNAA